MLPANAAAMSAAGAPRYSIFFYMKPATSPPIRAWLGFGDFEVAPDDVDAEGGIYKGIGLVGDVPALRQLVNGVAERVEFTLNGVDPTTFSLADDAAGEARNAQVHVGIVFFDTEWQAVDPVAWLWEGTADQPGVDRDHNLTRRVTLSVGSAFTDRTRPQLSFYTPADQKRRSPTDTFCDRVPAYGIDSTIQWPGPD